MAVVGEDEVDELAKGLGVIVVRHEGVEHLLRNLRLPSSLQLLLLSRR
nr:hypothetical protein Itr_chr04CG06580 [Ipomoea trifida]